MFGDGKSDVFFRFAELKCDNPKCKSCFPQKEVMQGINHRLFANNRSTATHWFPGATGTRKPILIKDLTPDHLAAIVDQYEGEALKYIEDNIRDAPRKMTDSFKRKSPIVQNFLNKNVKAWPGIKNAEWKLRANSPILYQKLFVEKKYNVGISKPVPTNPYPGFFDSLGNLLGKTVILDIKTPLNPEEYMNKAKPEYKPNAGSPTERELIKQRIALKLTQMRVIAKDIETSNNRLKEVSMEIEKLMTQL